MEVDIKRQRNRSRWLKNPRLYQGEIAAWVEHRLKENDAQDQFRKLIENRCDRQSLLQLLAAVALTSQADSWETFAGLHTTDVPETLKSISRRAQALADEIDEIGGHWLGIQIEAASPTFLVPLGFGVLPRILLDYANQLDSWRKRFKPGRENLIRNAHIGRLVSYVNRWTGRWNDAAVADLIAAVSGREDYTESAHRNWRLRHYSHMINPLAPYPAKPSMP